MVHPVRLHPVSIRLGLHRFGLHWFGLHWLRSRTPGIHPPGIHPLGIHPLGKVIALLDRSERRRLGRLVALMVVVGLFEAVGVAAVLPFLAVVADPSVIAANPALGRAYEALGTDEPTFLLVLGFGALALLLGSIAVRALSTHAMHRFAREREAAISARLLAAYLARPYVDFLGRHSADLGRTLLTDVDRGVVVPLTAAIRTISQATTFVAVVAVVVVVNPVAALFAAGIVGAAYGAVLLALRTVLNRLGAEMWQANVARHRVVQETLAAIREVKVMGLERATLEAYRAPATVYANRQASLNIVYELPRYLLEGIAFGGMIATLLVVLATTEGGVVGALPDLGLVAVAGLRLLPAAQQIFAGIATLRASLPALDRVYADSVVVPIVVPPATPDVAPIRLGREIAFEGVGFSFPGADRAALDGLTLTIKAFASVAFVGQTGAGKTTAVDVLLGLLVPDRGSLTVDGVAIDASNVRGWQRTIGMVPQQVVLSDASIAQNIALGVAPEAIDMAAVRRAAQIAQLDDIVAERPEGFAALVGERGVRLSGGQRQRIGIARALYHDPAVIVFDEATSALDNRTERRVMDAVRAMGGTKTVVMVAHRLSTVRDCDVIFVLDRGRVVARGTYDALLADDEQFRALAVRAEAA